MLVNVYSLRIIRGIIPPARSTITASPICKSNALIKPGLFNVARDTIAPSISTLSRIATGVTFPDLPVSQSTLKRVVGTPSLLSFIA